MCRSIQEALASWRISLPANLAGVPAEYFEERVIDGARVTVGTFKMDVGKGETLVVCQALVHTWSRPTFLSIGTVGRLYAEGLLVAARGDVEAAPDDLMWQFR